MKTLELNVAVVKYYLPWLVNSENLCLSDSPIAIDQVITYQVFHCICDSPFVKTPHIFVACNLCRGKWYAKRLLTAAFVTEPRRYYVSRSYIAIICWIEHMNSNILTFPPLNWFNTLKYVEMSVKCFSKGVKKDFWKLLGATSASLYCGRSKVTPQNRLSCDISYMFSFILFLYFENCRLYSNELIVLCCYDVCI